MVTRIDDDQVRHTAELAKLALDAQEAHYYATSMSSIFDLVEKMQAVDTTHVEPLFHLALEQPLREDLVTEVDQRALLQSQAPATEAGLYLVPKVIEEA